MSNVWLYFSKEGGRAICERCKKSLSTNTTGLRSHLRTQHGILCNLQSERSSKESSIRQPQITNFLVKKLETDSIESVVSKLCAKDGMSFSMVANSEILHKAIPKLGFGDLPTSSNTIRNLVLSYGEEVKQWIKLQIKQEIENVNTDNFV